MDLYNEFVDYLSESKGIEKSKISKNTTFGELSLDSLDIMEMLVEIEEKFGVEIEMNENLKTIGDVVAHIESKKSK